MTEGTLNIEVIGSVQQRFEVIDPNYTVEDIINLVKSGEAFTTIGHGGDDAGFVCLVPQLKNIAKIISQEAGDDLEIKWDYCFSVEGGDF